MIERYTYNSGEGYYNVENEPLIYGAIFGTEKIVEQILIVRPYFWS